LRNFLFDNNLDVYGNNNNDNDSDDSNDYIIGDTVKLRGGKKGTVRYIGTVTFDDGDYVGIELHNSKGKHDGAYRGVRYFSCPLNMGLLVKQEMVIGKVKNDPSRQYLTRKCPECGGDFIKCRNPQLAYNSVGIVCDGCCKLGNEFGTEDWYFQCGRCEQIDYCLKCMIKLPVHVKMALNGINADVKRDDTDDDDDIKESMIKMSNSIVAKYRAIGTDWMFVDIDKDETVNDSDDEDIMDDINDMARDNDSAFAPIKSIFDHFDSENCQALDDDDLDRLWKISKREFNRQYFEAPMTFEEFEKMWKHEIPQKAKQNVLDYMQKFVDKQQHLGDNRRKSIEMLEKVRDVFEYFDI